MHPAPSQMAVIAWHSPLNGYVSITGGVSDDDPGCGDGILWSIDQNSTNLASGGYPNGGSQTFATGVNGANLNSLPVSVGDVVYVSINPGGNYYCDSTGVDLTISQTTAATNTPTFTPTLTPTNTPTNMLQTIDDASFTYSGNWGEWGTSSDYDGTELQSNTTNGYVQYTFTGSSVTFYGRTQNNFGICGFYVDGNFIQNFDGYSLAGQSQVPKFTWSGPYGTHTIKEVVTGTQNPNSSNTFCDADYLTYQDSISTFTPTPTNTATNTLGTVDDADFTYSSGHWGDWGGLADYNDTEKQSNVTNDFVQYTFTGSSVTFYGRLQSNFGICGFYIDGNFIQNIDGYPSPQATQFYQVQKFTWSGPYAVHTIKEVVTGTKNPNASDYFCDADYLTYQDSFFTLTPTSIYTPTYTPRPTGSPTVTPTPWPTASPSATLTPQPTGTATPVLTPPVGSGPLTINYTYDPLNRLTAADYSNGMYYRYTYDSVGNRLTQQAQQGMTDYAYDFANRLTHADAVNYSWDNNGNLLSDGVNTYTYNSANQLTGFNGQGINASFAYDGLGDRLQQTVGGVPTNYAVDINSALPQVLQDGTNSYIYGVGNLAQTNASTTDYFLPDALGSTRPVGRR